MILKKWDDLPEFMKCDEVKVYYDILSRKKGSLVLKRIFDIVVGVILLILLSIPMLIIAVMIKMDSKGPVFYRQERVTRYGKKFRITRVGSRIRDYRLDELPQVFDVLKGNMSFVGTRPEATKYVEKYSNEMLATLLLPAGITSEASIRYKDEAKLLDAADDVDYVYVETVLPEKMKYNLESIRKFNFVSDIITMLWTVGAVLGKDLEK